MRDGDWSDGSVRETSAVVSGVDGHVASVSVNRSLPSSLPGQAAALGGWAAATADLELDRVRVVEDRVGTPWSRRTWPASGDPVTIDATDGVNRHRIFTGRVDGTTSSLADPGVSVGLVDDTDSLAATLSKRPLLREMPPRSTLGDGKNRQTALLNTYLPDMCARAAGYQNTPRMSQWAMVSAPMVGSTWPERGVLRDSYRSSGVGGWTRSQPGALTVPERGTIYLSDVFAIYEPDPFNTPWGGGIQASRPLSITLGARHEQAASSYVAASWVSTSYDRSIRLAVTSQRTVAAQLVHENSGTTTVVSVGIDDLGQDWEYVTLQVLRMSDTVLEWQIHTDNGTVKTGRTTALQTGTVLMNTLPDRVIVRIPPGCGLNGIQVAHPNPVNTPIARAFKRTFMFRPDTPLRAIRVMPALVAESARELLKSQAEAELAAVWLDEDGILHWLGRKRMLASPVVATLTSSQIADAKITMDAQDVRRRVNVRWTAWAARVARKSTLTVYEGSKDEFEADDFADEIISPPSGEQWIAVDTTPRLLEGSDGAADFNTGMGTFVGWTGITWDGEEFSSLPQADVRTAFVPVGPDTFRWSIDVRKLQGSAAKARTASRADAYTEIRATYRDRGLPLVRAMGRATSSQETASSLELGPAWAPELEHDTGWFVQEEFVARELADLLISELMVQRPQIHDLQILPDPRLQLGDKIRVEEQSRTGLSVIGVISDIAQPISPGAHEMTISLMVTEVQVSGVTWDEFDDWWDGMTLAQVDAAYKGRSFDEHDANPTNH